MVKYAFFDCTAIPTDVHNKNNKKIWLLNTILRKNSEIHNCLHNGDKQRALAMPKHHYDQESAWWTSYFFFFFCTMNVYHHKHFFSNDALKVSLTTFLTTQTTAHFVELKRNLRKVTVYWKLLSPSIWNVEHAHPFECKHLVLNNIHAMDTFARKESPTISLP